MTTDKDTSHNNCVWCITDKIYLGSSPTLILYLAGLTASIPRPQYTVAQHSYLRQPYQGLLWNPLYNENRFWQSKTKRTRRWWLKERRGIQLENYSPLLQNMITHASSVSDSIFRSLPSDSLIQILRSKKIISIRTMMNAMLASINCNVKVPSA